MGLFLNSQLFLFDVFSLSNVKVLYQSTVAGENPRPPSLSDSPAFRHFSFQSNREIVPSTDKIL